MNLSDPDNYKQAGTEFQNNMGRFGLCKAVWNLQTNQLNPATETQVMTCCLNTCKKATQECLKLCENKFGPDSDSNFKDYTNCRNDCARNILACENTCALSMPSLWRGNSPIIDCIKEYNCGAYPDYDPECLKSKKSELIKCCNRNCIPNTEMSCTDHCNVKYLDLIGKSQDPLLHIYDKFPKVEMVSYNKKDVSVEDTSWKWYLAVVIIFFSIMTGVIFFLNKNKK